MKKIVLIASLLLACAGFSFAQTTPAAPKTKDKPAKVATGKPATAPTPAAGPKKADGGPDIEVRYHVETADD